MHPKLLLSKMAFLALCTSNFGLANSVQQQKVITGASRTTWTNTPHLFEDNIQTDHQSKDEIALRYKKPTICDPDVEQFSGYLDIGPDKHFFFWFFESRNKPETDPVILWLNGGPGCSSLSGLFMELGPCRVNEEGTHVHRNDYSWNDKANVIFLDQPVNVGYSYGNGGATNTDAAAEDVYAFLQLFFEEFSQYAKLDFHVAGEAYAGHYVPAIGSVINNGNKGSLKSNQINLKSLLIGNGLTDPLIQYKYFADMACNNTYAPVLDETTCDTMKSDFPACERLIKKCYKEQTPDICLEAATKCNNDQIIPFVETGVNPYDVRVRCKGENNCYEINDAVKKFLNNPKVIEAVGAKVENFEACNGHVSDKFDMAGDWMHPYVNKLPELLEDGIRVLIYTGDADYICNWFGSKAWTMELPWSHRDEFVGAGDTEWFSERLGKQAGELRKTEHGTFAFLRIFGAGHMAPYDQPESTLDMLQQWVNNELD